MKRLALCLLALVANAYAADPAPPRSSGSITTQNLVPTGDATAGSCVLLTTQGWGVVGVEVNNTYTGALSAQGTVTGTTWTTLAPTPFIPTTAQTTPTATIGSGATGSWTLGVAGYKILRVCGLAAVTGQADLVLQAAPGGGVSSSSGGGGGGGAVTVADGADVVQGATSDAASTSGGTGTNAAKLRLITAQLATIDASINTQSTQMVASLGTKTAANSSSVTYASDGTLPLPTGAATAANQTAGSTTAATDATRVPVSEPDGLAVSGTCASSCTNVVLFSQSLVGYESWSVAVTSAGTGATITYQLSNDTGACGSATNWYNVLGWQPVAGASAAPSATSTTAVLTQFPRGSALCARAQITAYSSGTVTVAASFAKSIAGDGAKHTYVANMPVQTVGGSVGTTTVMGALDARTADPTAVSTGQAARPVGTVDGKQITLPLAIPELTWNYAAASGGETGTGDLTLAAAPAAGLRNYLTSCVIQNSSATIATEVVIKDSATVLKRFYVGIGSLLNSVVSVIFQPAVRQPTTATALTAANITTASAVYWNCNGYQGR